MCIAWRNSLQPSEWQKLSSLFFSREKKLLFKAGNFCKANDKEGGAGNESSRYQSDKGGKYATPDSTGGLIGDDALCPDHRRLCMLFWPARASDVLISIWIADPHRDDGKRFVVPENRINWTR
jgi:hypothetical protein